MPPKVSCETCGGTEFSLHDGHYYCKTCSTMSQRLIEFDDEALVNMRAKVKSTKANVPKKRKEKKKPSKFFEDGFDVEIIRHWTSDVSGDYPVHIRQTGRRVTTFARIVALWTETMITDFDVPESIREASIYLLQKYFSFYGIAFCEDAVAAPEEEKAKYKWKMRKSEAKTIQTAAQEKKKKLLAEKKNQLEQTQRDDFLSFINQTSEDAELAEQSMRLEIADEEINDTIAMMENFKEENFSLKKGNIAGKIYLEIDIVVSIIFAACQMVGATWITISDLSRWFREDRLEVTAAQLNGLGMAPDKTESKLDEFYKRCFKTPSGMYPRPESFACLFRTNDIIYPMDRCKSNKLLYDDMKRYISPDFIQLLELLSFVIGEDPDVVFLSFLMVETMYFRKKK
ncbi:hypothetical protein FO519_008369 [Halicephalobus sp. NKZ332]|nr:hypothetical protein FO519_008369 [Halicephalobus sp. NKZ332]